LVIDTYLLTSHLLTYLNWVRCDWSQPQRTGSLHSARSSSWPWLQLQSQRTLVRWNDVSWN